MQERSPTDILEILQYTAQACEQDPELPIAAAGDIGWAYADFAIQAGRIRDDLALGIVGPMPLPASDQSKISQKFAGIVTVSFLSQFIPQSPHTNLLPLHAL